ncbi:MAG: DNA-binding MarR family transcriptional regulator, partial [Psychroserpens sp.]
SRQTLVTIFLTNTLIKTELLSVLKPHDLSLEQFNVLRILRGQKGNPLNLQDVQERMVNKMSNTTRLVDKLILKNFVKRMECKKNRRKIEIYITKAGLDKLSELDSKVDATEEKATSKLTAIELKELNRLLRKIQ